MLEECRQKATPAVRACVIKEEQRIAATKAAPATPKDKEEEAALKGDRGTVAAGFVAPPRTIADITAILDSEKPDPAKIALRKTAADAEPPKGGSKSALAQFYYDRGNARASLARNEDALNDALKAWEVGQGATKKSRTRASSSLSACNTSRPAGRRKQSISGSKPSASVNSPDVAEP